MKGDFKMKVRLEDKYKELYTLIDLDHAKAVIHAEKEDEETAKGWAEYAAREALKDSDGLLIEVIKADAKTARNYRAFNLYCESGDMDVWIEFTAKCSDSFIEGGAYLSDIWQTGAVSYKEHVFIQEYKRV